MVNTINIFLGGDSCWTQIQLPTVDNAGVLSPNIATMLLNPISSGTLWNTSMLILVHV